MLADLAMAEQGLFWEESEFLRVLRARRRLGRAYAMIERIVTEDAKKDKKMHGIPRSRVMNWLTDSMAGIRFMAWRSLHLDGPEGNRMTRPEAGILADSISAGERDELIDMIVLVSGLDMLSSMDHPGTAEKVLPGRASKVKAREERMRAFVGEERFPARRIAALLAESYGWGPEKTGQLTLWQARMYLAGNGGQKTIMAPAGFPPTPSGRRVSRMVAHGR